MRFLRVSMVVNVVVFCVFIDDFLSDYDNDLVVNLEFCLEVKLFEKLIFNKKKFIIKIIKVKFIDLKLLNIVIKDKKKKRKFIIFLDISIDDDEVLLIEVFDVGYKLIIIVF